jgi:NADH-quinone oxidoreductase subunit C
MNPEEIHAKLTELLQVDLEWHAEAGDPFAVVPVKLWKKTCQLARDDLDLSFNFLRSLCGVDRPDDGKIEVVAHLFSYRNRHALVLKTLADRNEPRLESVAHVWPAAAWHERETYDLLGVHFDGHPDLRRIILPEDWVGHPLRKDYKELDNYNGIPTSRPGYEK